MQTYEDAISLKSAIEDLVLGLSGNTSATKEIVKDKLSSTQYDFVEKFFNERKVDLSNREDMISALKILQSDLEKIKPVDMAVAVEPDNGLKDAVATWFSANLGAEILPRYSVNRAYLGGAKITYNGIYLDLSLRKKLDELSVFKRKI